MVKQYPHFLFVRVVSESIQDGDGLWSIPTESWALHSICREETNGKGAQVNGPDGKAIVFSSTVFLSKSSSRIEEGTEVLVSDTNEATGFVRIKKQVLKFEVGQLNCRLWL